MRPLENRLLPASADNPCRGVPKAPPHVVDPVPLVRWVHPVGQQHRVELALWIAADHRSCVSEVHEGLRGQQVAAAQVPALVPGPWVVRVPTECPA